jgi:hypothetical protein
LRCIVEKMQDLPTHKQMFLLMNSHALVQMGNHQAIVKKYTNCDGIHVNYNVSIIFCSLKLGRIQLNAKYTSHFKIRADLYVNK